MISAVFLRLELSYKLYMEPPPPLEYWGQLGRCNHVKSCGSSPKPEHAKPENTKTKSPCGSKSRKIQRQNLLADLKAEKYKDEISLRI
jgi:hypothetical protein